MKFLVNETDRLCRDIDNDGDQNFDI